MKTPQQMKTKLAELEQLIRVTGGILATAAATKTDAIFINSDPVKKENIALAHTIMRAQAEMIHWILEEGGTEELQEHIDLATGAAREAATAQFVGVIDMPKTKEHPERD